MSFEAYWALSDEARADRCRETAKALAAVISDAEVTEDEAGGEILCEGRRGGRAVRLRLDVAFGAVGVEIEMRYPQGCIALVRGTPAITEASIEDVDASEGPAFARHDVEGGVFMEDVAAALESMIARLDALPDAARSALVSSLDRHGLVSLVVEADLLDAELDRSPLAIATADDLLRSIDALMEVARVIEDSENV